MDRDEIPQATDSQPIKGRGCSGCLGALLILGLILMAVLAAISAMGGCFICGP